MCFVGKDEKLIANEDIICYKVLKKKWFKYYAPVWTDHRYKRNKLYYAKFGIKLFKPGKIRIDEGLHSYKNMEDAKTSWGCFEKHIKKFIIPKGAEYYCNDKEYVSNQIIMK